ncbi:hypothetical protein EXIGLDRAFT_403508 [Exidia glandulosa HHB12029]|uniref:MYND-type domain-containing protein n=1 Tax=Exidia glandulosa HHB12029 TaxID=1314781 RepID=A0A165KRP4_EXIGL|nr:hypothetical protein EXIGLDRAFT_403508 [Exidia glandulosa HHB12029]
MMRFETPRLVVRSVKPADAAWTYSIKGDPRVNKYQFYGQPKSKAEAAFNFAHGYIRDRILLFDDRPDERHRYVFAITPKASEIPTPASNAIPRESGLPPFPPLPHENDIYIGNVAFELLPLAAVLSGRTGGTPRGPGVLCIPSDKPFVWPDIESAPARAELDQWAALLFYELAPQYWGQGLMLEAILSIADFAFYELGVGHLALDPQVANASSIAIARKLPDMEYASTHTKMGPDFKQHVFVLSRADYVKRFGPPGEALRAAGKRCCAWCYNTRAHVRGEGEMCQCGKRWYCGIECRAADWEADGGHGRCGRR